MKRKPPTKAESARLAAVKRLPCLACLKLKVSQPFPTEAHHLLRSGRRIGHDATVAICGWHHRSLKWHWWTLEMMNATFGPSLANGSKPFHAAFGDDDSLLAETNKLLSEQSVEAA